MQATTLNNVSGKPDLKPEFLNYGEPNQVNFKRQSESAQVVSSWSVIVSALEFLLQTNVGSEFTSAGEMLHVYEGLCSKQATVKIYSSLVLKI